MSHSSPHRHHHMQINPQQEVLRRIADAQPKPVRNQERPPQHQHELHEHINSDEEVRDNIHQPNGDPAPRSHSRGHHSPRNRTPRKASYNNDVAPIREEPEPFHERFGQGHNDDPSPPPPPRLESRGRNPSHGGGGGRSRSVPVSLDGRGRLGANFAFANNLANVREPEPERFQRATVQYQQEVDVSPEPERHIRDSGNSDYIPETRHSGTNRSTRSGRSPIGNPNNESFYRGQQQELQGDYGPTDQYAEDSYNGKITKRVSYSSDSVGMTGYPQGGTGAQSAKIACRLRTECIEADDDDDSSCNVGSCPKPRGQRSASLNRHPPEPLNPSVILVNSVDSQSSLTYPNSQKDADGFANKSSNNNNATSSGTLHSSQDSMLSAGGRPTKNIYSSDVLPLPIEIPESVADIQAFRRYLTVRRGALTSKRNSFEKSNQSSPSYESLGGRRPGRAPLGMTPSRAQLGHDANRRTASLSHAIMTLALLSASICQLRFLITYSHSHSYPVLNYFLIFTSIILELYMLLLILSQIAAGIGYVMISRCSYDDEKIEAIHNYLIFALFIVAVSNVILAAFAFDGRIVCESVKSTTGTGTKTFPSQSNAQLGQQQINQAGAAGGTGMNLKYNALE